MAKLHCDNCGETFSSPMNLRYHRDYVDCEPTSDSSTGTRWEQRRHLVEEELPVDDVEAVIQTYDDERGFGFAETADVSLAGSHDGNRTARLFVHITDVNARDLEKGDRIRCTVRESEKGLRAEQAEVIGTVTGGKGAENERPIGKRFGEDKNDNMLGWGKRKPTESDIESFKDERKFR